MVPILTNILVLSPATGAAGSVFSSTSKPPILWLNAPPVIESEYAGGNGMANILANPIANKPSVTIVIIFRQSLFISGLLSLISSLIPS
jgi:hypothetical protein